MTQSDQPTAAEDAAVEAAHALGELVLVPPVRGGRREPAPAPAAATESSPRSTPRRRSELDLTRYATVVREALRPEVQGSLVEAVGIVVQAEGCRASIGDLFEIDNPDGSRVRAEVVGLRGDRTLLVPLDANVPLAARARVRRLGRAAMVQVGDGLLGRVIDALGRPLDGRPAPVLSEARPLHGKPPSPLDRRPIEEPMNTGVRAIDALLTLGRGQRIGVFAGGGVGKSTLLGMMVQRAEIDVAVVGLVGERGREVEEFVRTCLGTALGRSVVVAATGAEPPQLRARAALAATTIAEHFREEGANVLLVLDSLTRFAMAMREIGLASGEPPTTKGYTPSVFGALPQLLERAGTTNGPGSITGLYTVLVEGDDPSDPISDASRAILDGHIMLRRSLAERGHFPAIDVPASVSRLMPQLASRERMERARRARALLAAHQEAEDLLAIGAYRAGGNPRLDEALEKMPKLEGFLRQETDERADPSKVDAELSRVWGDPGREQQARMR